MQPLPFSVHHLRLSGADREERRTPSRSPLPRPSRLPAPRYGRPWGSTAGRGACRTARPEARRLPFPPAKRRVKLCEVKSAVRRRRGGGGGSFVCLFPAPSHFYDLKEEGAFGSPGEPLGRRWTRGTASTASGSAPAAAGERPEL